MADNCSSNSTTARPAWFITDSMVCLPLAIRLSIGAKQLGILRKVGQQPAGSSGRTTAGCPFLTAFLVVRFIWRFSCSEFQVGKSDSLGFTRKTATPQPSTKPGTPPSYLSKNLLSDSACAVMPMRYESAIHGDLLIV